MNDLEIFADTTIGAEAAERSYPILYLHDLVLIDQMPAIISDKRWETLEQDDHTSSSFFVYTAQTLGGEEISFKESEIYDGVIPLQNPSAIISAVIVSEYRRYKESEIASAFTVEIKASGYNNTRTALAPSFEVGGYLNTVKAKDLRSAVDTWMNREYQNERLKPVELIG